MVRKKSWAASLGFFVLIMLILLFTLFPFLQMISTSLKYWWDWGNPSLIPKKINLEAYQELFNIGAEKEEVPATLKAFIEENPQLSEEAKRKLLEKKSGKKKKIFPFLRYATNSVLISASAAFCSVVVSIFGAYSLSRLSYPGRGVFRRGVFVTYLFGGILLLIPLYEMAAKLGLFKTGVSTFLTLMVVYMIQTLPVALYLLGNYFRTVPVSVEESAMLEGAGRLRTIFVVIIPISLPAIFSVFIYAFMIAWNEYLFASVFLKRYEDLYTLPMGLKALFSSKNVIWDRIMAASVLTATPVIALFTLIQKNLVGGISEGGVKG